MGNLSPHDSKIQGLECLTQGAIRPASGYTFVFIHQANSAGDRERKEKAGNSNSDALHKQSMFGWMEFC